MTMLSSVAERLYWTARYLERAESTARLVNAYTQFVLDIPVGFEPGWNSLIRTIDGEETFEKHYRKYTERNVVKFLIADTDNAGSVRYSIRAARENVRTTRDCLPESWWELVNELHLFVGDHAEASIARRNRFEFLERIAARMQQLRGIVHSSMPRDQAYRFMRIGSLIECADMTSRFVDVAAATTLQVEETNAPAVEWLWANLLRSLSALSAYRRETGPVTETNEIVDFIFSSKSFARSLHFCLNSIEEETEGLSNPRHVWHLVRKTRSAILGFDAENSSLEDLRKCIDDFQLKLGKLNNEIYKSWFLR
ncbi:MAG: alpha-E domain-containing protein [Woeseiaceae bacterium]|jgi:uncharacterized alpha-E superfamily protein